MTQPAIFKIRLPRHWRARLALATLIPVTAGSCSWHSEFATSATESFATATSSINAAFGESGSDYRQQLISGDFDGDGYLDNAYASVVGLNNWTLVVHFDVLNDSGGEIVVVDQHTPDVPVDEIRLETRPPGNYVTFCGRASVGCEKDKPPEIDMPSDGILLVVLEASASLVYWDPSTNSFVRHWLSD